MKNFFKKAIAVFAAATMTLSIGMTSFASAFPDVTQEEYPWAVDAIESMAKDGIIKGYEDGTFGPTRTVSKLESLVLISRILGYNDEINKSLVRGGIDNYGAEIDKYELNYGQNEIAYLLMKCIISIDELEEYISEINREDGLKRYEVAILLTKALDAESELSNSDAEAMTYTDVADIPANAKKYVAYISKIGLMQGLGDGTFGPNETVTRAQAAVVLYKLQAMTDYTYKGGLVASVDHTTRNIKIQNGEKIISLNAASGTLLRYNGNSISINDVEVGYDSVITYKNDKLYAIDFTNAMIDEVVYGSFVGSTSNTVNGHTVSVYELEENDSDINTNKKVTYKIKSDAIITYNDNTCTLSSLKPGNYVKLTVEEGIVSVIEAKPKDSKLSGRVAKVSLEPVYMLSIEDNEGNIKDYLVSSTVSVKKNGSTASARDILEGDSISVSLLYDRISTISATSRTTKKSGIIKEVIISSTPKITISVDGVNTTYAVKNSADIKISDADSTFYDLRVGMTVQYSLESDTIVSLKTTANNAVTTWEGTVILINASYDLLQIEFVDSLTGSTRTESVFVKSNASIVDYATQRTQKLSSIKSGQKVSVTGSMVSGIFEAGTVVIIG